MYKEKKAIKYSIKFDEDKKIIHYKHYGILYVYDVISAWDEIIKTNEYRYKGYNVISDYSDADFGFGIEGTKEIDDYLERIKHLTKGKKSAIIANKPQNIVIPLLYQKKSENELGFQIKAFTTHKAAQHFVSI